MRGVAYYLKRVFVARQNAFHAIFERLRRAVIDERVFSYRNRNLALFHDERYLRFKALVIVCIVGSEHRYRRERSGRGNDSSRVFPRPNTLRDFHKLNTRKRVAVNDFRVRRNLRRKSKHTFIDNQFSLLYYRVKIRVIDKKGKLVLARADNARLYHLDVHQRDQSLAERRALFIYDGVLNDRQLLA